MEPQETSHNGKKIGIGIAAVALLALIAVIFGAKKSADTPVTTPTVTDTASSTDSSTNSTPSIITTTSTSTATYKDGTYSATGSYMSPGGLDHLAVTLTLKNDIVTDATVTAAPGDGTSKYYQGIFIANYRPFIIGKNISSLKLSKVSGSSLTSGGFNDAVTQIKAQAKA